MLQIVLGHFVIAHLLHLVSIREENRTIRIISHGSKRVVLYAEGVIILIIFIGIKDKRRYLILQVGGRTLLQVTVRLVFRVGILH